MFKQFKVKNTRSVYLPVELIEMIDEQAIKNISSFNKVVLEVLLKEFLFQENKK